MYLQCTCNVLALFLHCTCKLKSVLCRSEHASSLADHLQIIIQVGWKVRQQLAPIHYVRLWYCGTLHTTCRFYPFKPLAAAKARYGAGLHNFKYEDPNVQYCNAFLCHRYKNPYTTCEYPVPLMLSECLVDALCSR